MGNFYVNVTLKGPTRSDIAAYLEQMGCKAFLTPEVDSVTTVCEEQCDSQDSAVISLFAGKLSEHFRCPAFAVLNHDDDLLAYILYDRGERKHAYTSSPRYFDGRQLGSDFDLPADQFPLEPEERDVDPELPAGGDPEALVQSFGESADPAEVARVLRTPSTGSSDKFVFAFERHEALLKALGLPAHALCFGYRYVSRGEFPLGVTRDDILAVGTSV